MKACPNCGINLDPVDRIARVGDLTVDMGGDCWWKGHYISLTGYELLILHALASARGAYMRAEALMNIIDSASMSNNVVSSVMLTRLRAKFLAVDPTFDRLPKSHGRSNRGFRWRVDRDAKTPCGVTLERA